ncbi:HlyU family transcriptional regulator [uncultured Jannaschia sp.]|uniref:HlyU family transcriptional regulator n=1 Tax=uncultured Jannaschia sp. TaxID=293347 RepID=UPI0026077994|nr:HlyU family transcriptional regulator [uncultured Jannaschia sp.]
MSILSRLFGGGSASPPATPTTEYQGFTITPQPTKTSDGFRIAALIEKDGQQHELIRADTIRDWETAIDASLAKARQVIDEQGDRIF